MVITWRRFVLVLLFIYLMARIGMAAVETTTLSGPVVMLGGVTATSGTVTATLSRPGDASDAGATNLVGGSAVGIIAADGTVQSFALVPNDAISPSGSFYTVTFSVTAPAHTSCIVRWSVATSPDPINLRAVTRLDAAPYCLEPL